MVRVWFGRSTTHFGFPGSRDGTALLAAGDLDLVAFALCPAGLAEPEGHEPVDGAAVPGSLAARPLAGRHRPVGFGRPGPGLRLADVAGRTPRGSRCQGGDSPGGNVAGVPDAGTGCALGVAGIGPDQPLDAAGQLALVRHSRSDRFVLRCGVDGLSELSIVNHHDDSGA